MALAPGTRLGPYEIQAAIGAGGMGEVYRARDTKLQRDVALKILPESFALDPDRVARFAREAQVLAALNHPHIAAIYGLEDLRSRESSDPPIKGLVMELVDGETLADRLSHRRALPVHESVAIARQVADALQAAHDKGIVHRDLKPGNIALTRDDDQVKVLDFGLAKYESGMEGRARDPDVTNSPTLTFAATQAGVILGTAAYMSPEQAKGRAADKRSDIWAFGCVLFEMLSGTRAFEGDDASDILAGVLRGEPNWSAVSPDVPPSIRTLIRRCLDKDRQHRIGDIAVARFLLDEATSTPVAAAQPAAARAPLWRRAAVLGAVAIGAAVLGSAVVWYTVPRTAPRVTRLGIAPPVSATPIVSGLDRDLAIAPDGTRIVYVGGNGAQMFVRGLDLLEPTPLTGLGAPAGPFFAPDGQWVGFFNANSNLRKVAITGGPPVVLCDLAGARSRGGSWGDDGTIVFATEGATGLMKVPATGGTPAVLTTPNRAQGEGDHLWPEFLPGGLAVLFTITSANGGLDNSQVAVLDVRTGQHKILVRGGSHAHYLPTGHLVYNAAGTLRVVSFDLDRLEVVAALLVPVLSVVSTTAAGGGNFDIARNGTLAYISGGIPNISRTLVWVDRQGREEELKVPPRAYLYPRLSPDGTRVALDIRDQQNDIWMWNLQREALTRITTDPALDRFPIWMPDGRQIVFSSDRAGAPGLYRQAPDGTGSVEQLTPGVELGQFAMSASPDGSRIVFRGDVRSPAGVAERDLMMLTLDKERRTQPLIKTPFVEQNGMISPDGRWLAYESNETGQFEIYVRPFPDVGASRSQISTVGGIQPLWARNSQELFFLTPAAELMSVQVGRGATWTAGAPVKLIAGRYSHGSGWPANAAAPTYDVSLDGRRFLMIKPVGGSEQASGPPNLIVVQNWLEDVKQQVANAR